MSQTNYALRLQASLKAEAERIAKAEGTTLNQFINVAVAEKISALRTADYFRDRAARGDVALALKLLDRAGGKERPRRGDELPAKKSLSSRTRLFPKRSFARKSQQSGT
ncbi:MAG: hypothetical protein SGJ03_12130 [Alphaproteobacteria bacterium]|nr:hypothetical protein [Alphaproteobacteria bacterium]